MRPAKTTKPSEQRRSPTLRKFQPTCKPPTGAVMRRLSASEAQRLRRRLTDVTECVFTARFSRAGAEARFSPGSKHEAGRTPRSLSSDIELTPKRKRSLSRDEEVDLFLRFNYCRYRIMKILKAHAGKRLTAEATRRLLWWDGSALDIRERIVGANLGLVPSMVERSRLTGVDFAELISEGQLALLRSVGKFDCLRGFKFSTYACRAILTSISRAVALMARHRARFPTEYDPDLQKSDLLETKRDDLEASCVHELTGILASNSADLTTTERRVLSERFGMRGASSTGTADSKTLRQVAEVFGVTKERVRQIQNKALAKLRGVLDQEVFVTR